MTIAELLAVGRLERVPADRAEARDLVAHAERHLRSASRAMRRSRNRTEYGGVTLGRAQIETDLAHAARIVAAVRARLDGPSEPG